jgi:hypothetical protein
MTARPTRQHRNLVPRSGGGQYKSLHSYVTTVAAFMGNLQGFDDALEQLPQANSEMTLDVVL